MGVNLNPNRREFVILTCAAAAAGCSSQPEQTENAPVVLRPASIDAGPAAGFASDGVYDSFARQGFFIIRRGNDLLALSSICTHRNCKLKAEPDHSFYCKCHGSTFDPAGHVTEGPAKRDLPVLPTAIDDRGHLMVLALPGTARRVNCFAYLVRRRCAFSPSPGTPGVGWGEGLPITDSLSR